jgi:hypothetical protein
MNNTRRTIFGAAMASYFITVFIDISRRSLGMAALAQVQVAVGSAY